MITVPRFFNVNGSISLVFVQMAGGVISDVSSPVRLQGGETPQLLIATIDQILGRALHEAPVLEVSDLPEELQSRFAAPPAQE